MIFPLHVLHKGQRGFPSMNEVAFQTLQLRNKQLLTQPEKLSIVVYKKDKLLLRYFILVLSADSLQIKGL